LTLLSPGFKYKKSGGTKTYKILKLQNKKRHRLYLEASERSSIFSDSNQILGKPAFATEIQKKCVKLIFLEYN
jgi:hypothetical protein